MEAICDEQGDEEGLRGARRQLASLFEDRGEVKEHQGQLQSAANFYRRAWDKYGENEDLFDQQRVLGKLIAVYENLGNLEKALDHSYERIELLCQLDRPHEAERCYFHAMDICANLPEESHRTHWEQKLTKLVLRYFGRTDDIARLQRIAEHSAQDDRLAIYQLVVPVIEQVLGRIQPSLTMAA